jgi:hypothetical protein
VLCCAVLCCAVLCCAVLCCAVLCCAVLLYRASLRFTAMHALRCLHVPDASVQKGVTALQYAMARKSVDIVKLLSDAKLLAGRTDL